PAPTAQPTEAQAAPPTETQPAQPADTPEAAPGDPFAQAEAILARAREAGQADPKTADELLKKLAELKAKLASAKPKEKDLNRLRAELAKKIRDAERDNKLEAQPAAELKAALAPLGIDTSSEGDGEEKEKDD
ncbi:MAG TPA: hypothetical protein VGE07_17575, partial [Herpetosiphonaceae bacterium]